MKAVSLTIALLILMVEIGHGAAFFSPEGISRAAGSWSQTRDGKKEPYDDYFYNKVLMFRVLSKYSATLNCLLAEAKRIGGKLKLADSSICFFDEQNLIKHNFSAVIVDQPKRDNITDVDPQSLDLFIKNGLLGIKHYYVQYEEDNDGFEITKAVYDAIKLMKDCAIKNGRFLQINFSELFTSNAKPQNCVSVVPIVSNDLQCPICRDHAKEVKFNPCHHVCVCEDCSAKVDNCPICRTKISGKQRVFI